jgi:hypothetical protein
MNLRSFLILVLLVAAGPVPAQWDDAQLLTHPRFPGDQPFVLEVSGTWDTACSPQQAEPVITAFDGGSLEIEFIPGDCGPVLSVPAAYRVLVDVSEAFEGDEGYHSRLDVTLHMGDESFNDTIALDCALCDPPPPPADVWPEPGLYQAMGREKQGLLLARQGGSLAVYPLVYDDNGSAEWLFAGGPISGDAYFAPLYQASGGQCLGCPPPAEPPLLDPIAALTMVFYTEGTLQMQIDQGPFVEYRQLNYGRTTWGPELPDLSGTWAVLESRPRNPLEGVYPPAEALPGVFEIRFQEVLPQPIVPTKPPPLVRFQVRDLQHVEVGSLVCQTQADIPPPYFESRRAPLKCELSLPGEDETVIRFEAALQSMDRMDLTALEPPVPEGYMTPIGVIVRAEP